MESLDYWRLCDELSVVQAALLIIGEDPSSEEEYILGWEMDKRPKGFNAVFAALKHAITSGTLSGTIRYDCRERGYDEEPRENESIGRSGSRQIIYSHFPDWHLTTVRVDKLKQWLISRGVHTGFFFPDTTDESPDYLSPQNPFYAPKLAAAIHAWQHVTENQALLDGKTPKKALEKWLRENASAYGLTKDDGKPNELGITDAAKVANWKMDGGAPKTPNN